MNPIYRSDGVTGSLTQDDQFDTTAAGTDVLVTAATKAVTKSTVNQTDKTLFAGVRGSVGDTGVSYLLQVRSKKSNGKEAYDMLDATSKLGDGDAEAGLRDIDVANSSPWMFGLSRSLGGGASVHFEHSDPDKEDKKSTSYLALKVDF